MALDFKVVDSYNHKMTKDELIQELKDSIMTGDVQKQKDLVSDMTPFDYRDTYAGLLDDIVMNDYGMKPKFKTPPSFAHSWKSDALKRYLENPNDPKLIEFAKDMDERYGFGYEWSDLKSLIERGRVPLTNDVRYNNPDGNNILNRRGAAGTYNSGNRHINIFRPEFDDINTWKPHVPIHELLHDHQNVNYDFDPVPYAYHDKSIANENSFFGNILSKTNSRLRESVGGQSFMNDLYIHDRPMFDKLIKNRGDLVSDIARGAEYAEDSWDPMGARSYFSRGADMAEAFWKRHHKFGVAERDSSERLLSGKKLRSITGALPYIGATMAGLSAWDSAKAGDYEGAGKTIGKEALSHVPFIGDSLEPVGGKEDMVDSYLSEVAHKVSEEEDRLINLVKNKKLEGLSNE